ncbi:MAG TPA: glycosyltransferase family 1 protein [Candidatus Angelobacter sp.]
MRVAFDARWYNDSGVGTHVAGLLRAMAAADRDFELVVYEHANNPIPALDGLSIIRVPVRSPKYSSSGQNELRRRAREDRLDLFHSPFYPAPFVLPCPVVVTIHDLIPFRFQLYPWPKQWMVKTGYRTAVRRARHIIAVSQHTADDIKSMLGVTPERVTVIHNAVAADCFHRETRRGELEYLRERYGVHPPYALAASARNWRTKNLESALQALEIARSQGVAKFQPVVYGPGEGLDALNAEQRWPLLNLRRTGYVAAADLAALFRHAQVFVMPSLYEGFGLPVLEAMSCGCAVVTSNAGSLPEIAGKGARMFEPFDVAGMAGAIARLLCNPEELHRSRVSALVRAADFSWDKAARETISVYHRLQSQSSVDGTGDTQKRIQRSMA